MANGHGEETPRTRFATAQATLGLAIRINAEAIAGRLRRTIFERDVVVVTGGSGLVLPPYLPGTQEDLNDGTYNLVQLALGASALTADETLELVYGPLSKEADSARRNMRVMVHQVRNAFAHNPWRPKWVIRQQYRYIYPVVLSQGLEFSFDATSLNDEGVKPEHVGGLEFWVKLLKHCEGQVA
jgi:hypothetical protein